MLPFALQKLCFWTLKAVLSHLKSIGFTTQKLIFIMLDVKLLLMQTFFINFADCSLAFQKRMLFIDNGYYDK